jgi:hypothetical protein
MSKAAELAKHVRSLKDFKVIDSELELYNHVGATLFDAVFQAGINYKHVINALDAGSGILLLILRIGSLRSCRARNQKRDQEPSEENDANGLACEFLHGTSQSC